MNLILFDEPFESIRFEASDPRADHLRRVLRVEPGSLVYLGFVNGPRVRAEVTELEADGAMLLQVVGSEPSPDPLPIQLLVGMVRPHTAQRVLFEAASLGVAGLHFFPADRSEPDYAKSSLWSTDKWRDRLKLGAEQAFTTHLPEVVHHADLQSVIECHSGADGRICLDNYEADGPPGAVVPPEATTCAIAIGVERGWSPAERDLFRDNAWKIAHLGPHVLRTETACATAIAAVATAMNLWNNNTTTELKG